MTFETILTDVEAGILTITLNRPDRLNAFTPVMMRELIAAFDQADTDDDVRAPRPGHCRGQLLTLRS